MKAARDGRGREVEKAVREKKRESGKDKEGSGDD